MLEQFQGTRGENNLGSISRDDFFAHYREVATGIPSDEYFVRHIEGAWNIFEDSDRAVDRSRIQEIMRTIRHKITLKSNGKIEEYTLRTMFRSFDRNNNGVLSLQEVEGLLSTLAIKTTSAERVALFKILDRNNTGVLEFEEFVQFVLENPYK